MSPMSQASDITITPSPLGDTSRMSTSSGAVWPKRWRVMFTSVIGPGRPFTTTDDGYGAAIPEVAEAGIAIGAG